MKEDVEKTKAVGMNKHLNKPIEIDKLFETLLEFIPRKINIDEKYSLKHLENESIELPEFKTIDVQYGLNLVMGLKSTFKKVLNGLVKYKYIPYEELNDEELERTVHSLKGLSKGAGAFEISEIAEQLEKSLDRNLIMTLKEKLFIVVNEIEEKLENKQETKKQISEELKKVLFENLKIALYSKKVKECKNAIHEIEKYDLDSEDKELFENIQKLVQKYKFKEAQGLFHE